MSYTLCAEQQSVYIGSNVMLCIALSPKSHHMLVRSAREAQPGFLMQGSMLSQWYEVARVTKTNFSFQKTRSCTFLWASAQTTAEAY